MKFALHLVALVLFAAATLIGWTSDDTTADVLRDCVTLIAAGLGFHVAARLVPN